MKIAISCLSATCLLLTFTLTSPAYSADDGSIGSDFVQQLHKSLKMDSKTQAIQNAVTNGDLKEIALNRRILQNRDNHFSNKIKKLPITNQHASGRCWMFAGLNILRPVAIEKHKLKNFEFSESHLAFWDKLEKANTFLEDMIDMRNREPFDREMDFLLKDPIPDGGYWNYAVALIKKHGVVPKSVMPETAVSQNTKVMNSVLERLLRVDAGKIRAMAAEKKSVAELRKAKKRMLAQVYRVLVINYGEPPLEFNYRYADKQGKLSKLKRYTPQSFYKDWVGEDLDQYVTLGNDPTHPFKKHYKLRRIRNIVGTKEFHYVNIPLDKFKEITIKCLLAEEPVWFGADVTHDMDRADGIMQIDLFDYEALYGVDLSQSKAERLLTRGGVSNHAMTFIGVDLQKDKPVKWLVENSWGDSRGAKGFWTMYDEWFDQHVYSIVVRKAYVPNDFLKIFKQKATDLPPWAPMFSPFQ